MKVNIITGPFGCLPPYAIGAVEKLWYSIGTDMRNKGHQVIFISKKPLKESSMDDNLLLHGYERTGSWVKDFVLDFVFSIKALSKMPKCDMLVLNSIWSPILCLLFKWKYRRALYNVARFPKKQMGAYFAMSSLACVSTAVYNALIEQSPSMKSRACVIPNPIDTHIFCNEHMVKTLSDSPEVVYSGRVHKEKGLDILVKAVTRLHEVGISVGLRIIGATKIEDGGSGEDYVDYLESLVRGYRITWVEPIFSPSLLAKEIRKGDIFCYPSIAGLGETFGVAPLEAMGLGLVPIVSNLDCFKDFIVDNENGLVFDHTDVRCDELLANCLMRLLSDEKMYSEMSAKAIKKSAGFSVSRVSDMYMSIFKNHDSYMGSGLDTFCKVVAKTFLSVAYISIETVWCTY